MTKEAEHDEVVTSPELPTKSIPPADVGLQPWLQVIGGFFLMFNAWGQLVSFGIYQSYYESGATLEASPSSIAWIGSIQAFLLLFIGALCGRIFDAGYLRHLIVTGSFLIVSGLMMTSLIHTYWQALLAHGICVGLGFGCLLVPSIGAPSTWFIRHRGLAIGCVTSGAAVGGVVLPIAVQHLIEEIGFPWAVRVSAFIALATLSLSFSIMKQRLPPRKKGAFFGITALKEPELALYGVGMLTSLLGFYVFYNFVQVWVEAVHLDTAGLNPIYLLPIMNAASIPGRTLPTILSDTVGPLNVQAPAILCSGILVFAWLGVTSLPSLLVIAILYGFASGALIALPPAAVASLTCDMTRFGARMGVVLSLMSLGSLIGSPVTGAIIQSGSGENYNGARIWTGVTLVVGACLVGMSRMWISRREGRLILKA